MPAIFVTEQDLKPKSNMIKKKTYITLAEDLPLLRLLFPKPIVYESQATRAARFIDNCQSTKEEFCNKGKNHLEELRKKYGKK